MSEASPTSYAVTPLVYSEGCLLPARLNPLELLVQLLTAEDQCRGTAMGAVVRIVH